MNTQELMVTAMALVSDAILYDETNRQATNEGKPIVQVLTVAGIIPGIKVDAGAVAMRVRISGHRPLLPIKQPTHPPNHETFIFKVRLRHDEKLLLFCVPQRGRHSMHPGQRAVDSKTIRAKQRGMK